MSEISNLLSQTVAQQISAELQKNLKGIFGGLVRSYLPQVWWFTTESGSATLYVDRAGNCQITDGQSGGPDVSIVWNDAAFRIALTTRDRRQIPSGTAPPQIQTFSGKGATAFNVLRKRLGL